MKFDINELPLRDFALLGLSKNDILSLPSETKGSLMNGGRTSFMRFKNIPSKDGRKYYIDARMSLERNSKGEVKLKIHPRQAELKNSFGLNPEQRKYLSENPEGFVDKNIPSEGNKKLSVYYDSLTNEYIAIDRDKINAPLVVKGEILTREQKAQFKNGEKLQLRNSKLQLSPTNETGIEGPGIKMIDFDRYSYTKSEKFFDATLLATGYAPIIFLEHLLRFALLFTKKQQENNRLIYNQQVNKALAHAQEDIIALKKEMQLNNKEIKPDNIKDIINRQLAQEGVADITTGEAIIKDAGLIVETPADKIKSPQNKSIADRGTENQPGVKSSSVLQEIAALNTTGLSGNIQKAVADTHTQLNEFKQFGVTVPDGVALKILSHHLLKNEADASDINLSAGKLQESLKHLQVKITPETNSPKIKS